VVPRGGPERLQWAVDRLRLNPQAHVLEVGCGDGRALELVCDRLVEGRAVGVDRSRTAIDRARLRLADQLASGRVELRQADLDTVELPAGAFDTVLAVNVNRFWTRDAVPVLASTAPQWSRSIGSSPASKAWRCTGRDDINHDVAAVVTTTS